MDNNSLWPGRSKWLIAGAALIFLFVLLSIFSPKSPSEVFINNQLSSQETTTFLPYTAARAKSIEGEPQFWMTSGFPQAPLVIVEFNDFTCPHCKASYAAVNELRTKFADKVRLIIRTYAANDRAIALALAGHCAGEQGKYWEMSDKLFQRQSETLGNDLNELLTIASEIRLDGTVFRQCLTSKKYLDSIKTDMQASQTLNVPGTPTWFFNGIQQAGEVTVEGMTQIVNDLLK